jgi:hypothetical protein
MFYRMVALPVPSAIAVRIAAFLIFLQNDYMLKKYGY